MYIYIYIYLHIYVYNRIFIYMYICMHIHTLYNKQMICDDMTPYHPVHSLPIIPSPLPLRIVPLEHKVKPLS